VDFWDELAQDISQLIAARIPKANTTKLTTSISNLQTVVKKLATKKGNKMTSTPPPAGAVWILQSDLDADAAAINSAVQILQGLVTSGELSPANEAGVNAAVASLTALAVVPTPPAPPSS
jgi:hypothetical protein